MNPQLAKTQAVASVADQDLKALTSALIQLAERLSGAWRFDVRVGADCQPVDLSPSA
jgi:hypothetical protein